MIDEERVRREVADLLDLRRPEAAQELSEFKRGELAGAHVALLWVCDGVLKPAHAILAKGQIARLRAALEAEEGDGG